MQKIIVKTKNIIKICVILMVFAVIFLFLIYFLKKYDVLNKINSVEKIQRIISESGFLSCVIFVLLQFLQTTILQIPSAIVTIAGTIIFGRGKAFVLSFVAIFLGSIFMFALGRIFGKNLLQLLGGKKLNRLLNRVGECKYVFVLMMLFPFFPDDLLCAVAGVSNMDFRFFICVIFATRAISIATLVFFGNGKVIPFYGWGIFVWIIIFAFMAVLGWLCVKYEKEIDATIKQFFDKKGNKQIK